jgi:copper homeostasis protein CutC
MRGEYLVVLTHSLTTRDRVEEYVSQGENRYEVCSNLLSGGCRPYYGA